MANLPRLYVNVDGTIHPASEARISPLDHGFLYGDSVYETLRTYSGRPFLLGRHLDRLQRSLDRIFLSPPLSRRDFEDEIYRTLRCVPIDGDVGLRIVVSRGEGPLGLDIAKCGKPIFLIYEFELSDAARAPEPVGVVISKTRRNSPRALDPSIKSGNFLNNIFAFKEACDAGAGEALLCSAEGYLAEGTTSNVFVVKDGFVWTPRTYGILDGITRGVIFEAAEKAAIPIGETNIPPEALFSADEIFLTSSIKGIMSVATVNGQPIGGGGETAGGNGRPAGQLDAGNDDASTKGVVTRRLVELYAARIDAECRSAPRKPKENIK